MKMLFVTTVLAILVAGCTAPRYSGHGTTGAASPDATRTAPPAGQTSHGVIKD